MNLTEFINNPMGKGAVIPGKYIITENLKIRYQKLIDQGNIEVQQYLIDGNRYIFHFLIGSESERNNNYDIVIEFVENPKSEKEPLLLNCDLAFYSNCPSFIFTYAYVYNRDKMIIDFLVNKYDHKVTGDAPTTRNPDQTKSYEKSTYYACLYLQAHRLLLTKASFERTAIKMSSKNFAKKIRSSSKMLAEVEKEQHRISEEKKEAIKKVKDAAKHGSTRQVTKSLTDLSNRKNVSNVRKITPKKKIHGKSKISGKRKRR